MNDKIETQGKTVQDAVAEALLRLGARRDEVIVKIIEEPKSGFLGLLGGRPAKVEVEKKRGDRSGRSRRRPRSRGHNLSDNSQGGNRRGEQGARGNNDRNRRPAARSENNDNQGQGRRSRRPQKDGNRQEAGRAGDRPRRDNPRRDNPKNEKKQGDGRSRNRRPRAAAKADNPDIRNSSPEPRAMAPEKKERNRRDERNENRPRQPRNRRGTRNDRPRQSTPSPRPATQPVARAVSKDQEVSPVEKNSTPRASAGPATMVREGLKSSAYAKPTRGVNADDVKGTLETLAGGMLIRAGFPCRCQVMDGEYLQVRVVTDDASAGMLIGRHGSTVDSVEHLVERMISTASGDRVKMNLDINNYRRRRQDTLADRVYDAIGRVKETGRAYHMEPMNARERRLVHLQVAETEGLATVTVIEDGAKHVVISREEGVSSPGDSVAGATEEAGLSAAPAEGVQPGAPADSPQPEAE